MSQKVFFPPRPSTNQTIYAYVLEVVASHKAAEIHIGSLDASW